MLRHKFKLTCEDSIVEILHYYKMLLPFCTIGIAMTRVASTGGPGVDIVTSNQITDYSFFTQPFTLDEFDALFRCASGLGPPGADRNVDVGRWYFNGNAVDVRIFLPLCTGPVTEVRGADGLRFPGVVNLYLCGTFTTTEEGVYSCIMMNSSIMNQTMRVGVYLSGRSESLDMYHITSLLSIFYLSAQLLQQ